MGIDPSTMVALLDGLEGAGLAGRRTPTTAGRGCRDDAKGRKALERGRKFNDEVEDEVLEGPPKSGASCSACSDRPSSLRRRSPRGARRKATSARIP